MRNIEQVSRREFLKRTGQAGGQGDLLLERGAGVESAGRDQLGCIGRRPLGDEGLARLAEGLVSRDRLHDRLEIICDGGIRRGTHIVKALAMGANACSIGRAYLYPLAAGGQAGVERGLELLRGELERTMALLGCNDIEELGDGYVQHARKRH